MSADNLLFTLPETVSPAKRCSKRDVSVKAWRVVKQVAEILANVLAITEAVRDDRPWDNMVQEEGQDHTKKLRGHMISLCRVLLTSKHAGRVQYGGASSPGSIQRVGREPAN